MQIGASLLSADFRKLGQQVTCMEQAGVDFWHLDIMDGIFVPNFTFGVSVIEQLPTSLPLQIHFMVEHPDRLYEVFSQGVFTKLNACEFIFHVENTNCDLIHLLAKVRHDGHKVGLAISPATMVSELDAYLDLIDTVLIMSVNPGFSGQKFISGVLGKIEHVKSRNSSVLIGLDGGIDEQVAGSVNLKNVDFLISGSYLFSSPSPESAVGSLK